MEVLIYYSFCLFEWKLERIIGALIGGGDLIWNGMDIDILL